MALIGDANWKNYSEPTKSFTAIICNDAKQIFGNCLLRKYHFEKQHYSKKLKLEKINFKNHEKNMR